MSGRLSAIIVSFSDPVATRAAVDSLLAGAVKPDEIIVVDNHPDRRTLRAEGSWGGGVTLCEFGGNVGYTRAANLAAARADGEWLLFLNPDAVASPGCVEALLDAADDRCAIVGAQVLLAGGERTNAGANPVHITGLSWSGGLDEVPETGPPRDVAACSGAALLVRASAYAEIGGMCEPFFLYHDDVDLAWRARLRGWRVRYCPAATVVHDYEFDKGREKWFWLERNRAWSVLANYRATTLLVLAPLLVAAELGILAIALREGWTAEKLRAWADLWRSRSSLASWRAEVQGARRVGDREILGAMTGRIETPMRAGAAVRLVGVLCERYRRMAMRLVG